MNLNYLLSINFLHYIAAGMVLPVIPRSMKDNGGNHFIIGTMSSTIYICMQLNRDTLALLPRGKRYALRFSLSCSLLAFLILVFHQTLLITWLTRCFYAITTNTVNLSKDFVQSTEPENTHIINFNMIDFLKMLGLAVGAICGGYTYEFNKSISSNALAATVLALVCLFLLEFIESDNSTYDQKESRLLSMPSICLQRLQTLRDVDLKNKWTFFWLKTTYIVSVLLYLPRWVYIVIFNYYVCCARIGYVHALEQIVIFCSNCFIPFVKTKIKNHERLLEYVMILGGFLLFAVFYAPTYECHLFFFGVVMFTYILANSLMDDDVFGFKTEPNVYEASETLTTLCNICVPIVAGAICHFFGGKVMNLTALLPVGFYFKLISQKLLETQD